MHEYFSRRAKVAAIFVAILLVATFIAAHLPEATASPSPVEIISIDPVSGPVGEMVRVIGSIDTDNGSYRILFDGVEVKNGTATGTAVDATFKVPLSAKGYHNVTVVDVSVGDVQSSPAIFNVITSYYVNVKPTRIQEGRHTTIEVGVNEAEVNTTLTFAIKVTDPGFSVYNATLDVPTNATGSASYSVSYHENFSAGAHTNYVGLYNVSVVAVNETLAEGNFSVGLTDRLDYGRTETETKVYIRGAGYEPDEGVQANITIGETSVAGFLTVADAQGAVTYVWQIPKDAQLGIYAVTLANGTGVQIKPVPDIQNFVVTEVTVYCQTLNKYDKEPLADVFVVAVLLGETTVTTGMTNETGWTELKVTHGNYTFKAFWENEEVGSLKYSILENTVLPPIGCELSKLTVTIKDETGFPLPFIKVTLDSNKTGYLQSETNNAGTVETNTFTNVSYTIEAWRYGHLFDSRQIANLTDTLWLNITCPTYKLFVNVLDSKGTPLRNADVDVFEWSSGVSEPVESETTDNLGNAVFDLTFGRYRIWVYNDDHTIVLNKTVVDLTEDQMLFAAHCKIFNVDLSVIVKDYFGQPIPNALVEFERENTGLLSEKTGSNGIASFINVTGGDCQITVSLRGTVSETKRVNLDETKTIAFRLEKTVVMGGYPLEITQIITYVSLGIVIALFALVLTYRRLRHRKVSEEDKEKSY